MTTPTEEHDVDVPLRLQPVVARSEGWRGRSINLIAVGLAVFVVFGIVLGTTLDNGGPSPTAVAAASATPVTAAASPSPTRRPTPTPAPLATALPTIEVYGTELPDERRLVTGSGQQILDLANGTIRSFGRQYEDVLWPVGDEIVCVCLVRFSDTSPAPSLRFARFDLRGTPIVERDLLSLEDAVAVPEMSEGFNMAAAIDTAGMRLVLVDVKRVPPNWIVELHLVDARTGELLDSAVVDTFPVELEEPQRGASPSPRTQGGVPDGMYAWASQVVLAPDGGHAFITVAQSEVRGDQWTGRNLEWLVPIVDDHAGEPSPLSSDARLAVERWCVGRATFLDADLIVQLCGPPSRPYEASYWSVRRLTVDSVSLGDLPIGAAQSDGTIAAATIVDRPRRSVVMWDPFRHLVSRVDVDTGRVHEGVVAESMLPGDRRPRNRGWIGVDPGLVASVDGSRLFALGLASGPSDVGTSTGVWVFDAETLELLDHWEARALLTSLAVSADGRFVYASSAAGYDVDGRENPRWPASVTVYDATTGEIVVLYGSIGDGQWLSFQAAG